MTRIAITGLLWLASACALAEPVDLSCFWGKPVGKAQGAPAAVAKLYADASDPLFLRVDAAAGTVAHNDPSYAQAGVLPKLRLTASGDRVTVTASGVNLRELGGIESLLEVSIDRYSLESEMLFLMAESVGASPSSQWTRSGRCTIRRF